MLWGQLLQCTTAEEGKMASRLLLKACLPYSHPVHTERHTYHTCACNRGICHLKNWGPSCYWHKIKNILYRSVSENCLLWSWVHLTYAYVWHLKFFRLFLILQFPPHPAVSMLVTKGYLYNCNMSNLTWCPNDQKSGYTLQWCTSVLIWQLWWQWHRELQFWTTSLFHVTVVLRYWHIQ